MKKIVLFMLTLAILSSMFILPSFAATGTITVKNAGTYGYFNETPAKITGKMETFDDGSLTTNSGLAGDDVFFDGKAYILKGKSATSDGIFQYGEGANSSAPVKTKLAEVTLDNSADVYIAVCHGWGTGTLGNTDLRSQWMKDEGYEKAYDSNGNVICFYNSNGGYYVAYKKSVYASSEAPATVDLYSLGQKNSYAYSVIIKWKENPSIVDNSTYVFKGKSGEEGDDNVYTYIFSKMQNADSVLDYGVSVKDKEENDRWFSLVKDDDKTQLERAISSGIFAIGLADNNNILGDYTAIPQIRYNGAVMSSGTVANITRDMPENGSDSSLKSVSLSTDTEGANAVFAEEFNPEVLDYNLYYNDATCFNHTISAESNDLSAGVVVKKATVSDPVATVTVTSENGNTSLYTFNYNSLSDYNKSIKATSTRSAYTTAISNWYSAISTNASKYGYIYNGTTQDSVAIIKFSISDLAGVKDDIYLSMKNVYDQTKSSLNFNIWTLTGDTTSTDYNTVIAMKDKLVGTTTINGTNGYNKGYVYIAKLDKDIILDKLSEGETTLTMIIENPNEGSNSTASRLFGVFWNHPLSLIYKK